MANAFNQRPVRRAIESRTVSPIGVATSPRAADLDAPHCKTCGQTGDEDWVFAHVYETGNGHVGYLPPYVVQVGMIEGGR